MHKRYLTLVVCCAAAAIAGCGSSNGNGGTTSGNPRGPVSEGVFVADTGALCTQASAASKAAKTVPAKLAVIDQYLPQFTAIKPPPSQQALYSKILADLKAESTAGHAKDYPKVVRLAHEIHGIWVQLHISACTKR